MFTLINASGDTLDIVLARRHAFDVSGMGYERNTEYIQAGSRFIPLDNRYAQGKIGGSMRFKPLTAYTDYYALVRFTDNAPLTLRYTNSNGVYYRDVVMSTVERGELLTSDDRVITFELTALGLWYRIATAINDGEVTNGKIYPYTYQYTYGEQSGVVRIQSDSYEDSPAKLTIFGPVVNPAWRHIVNGHVIATGAVNASVPADMKLVIDATVTPYRIETERLNNEFVTDYYGSSDFSTERFIILRHGLNVITVETETQIMTEGRLSYASV